MTFAYAMTDCSCAISYVLFYLLQLLKDARKEAASASHKELQSYESPTVAACSSVEDNIQEDVPDDDIMIQSLTHSFS